MERARNMLGSPQMVGVPIVVTSARLMVTEPTCTTGWSSAGSDLSLSDSDVSMPTQMVRRRDRKSTRLNSSHLVISYAVFCLKKKKHLNVPRRPASDFEYFV